MRKYRNFDSCQACLICVGPECLYEQKLYQVGPFKICGSCFQRLNEKGYIDLDSFRRLGEFTRLYPDGSTRRMKGVLKIMGMDVVHIPAEQPVPAGARLYNEDKEECPWIRK